MKLKYEFDVRKRKVTINLETVCFTPKESEALEMFGEPVVEFHKVYDGGFSFQFSKKIRSQFKFRLTQDGTDDIDRAIEACDEFLRDIQEVLKETMEKLMEKYDDQIMPDRHGVLDITQSDERSTVVASSIKKSLRNSVGRVCYRF